MFWYSQIETVTKKRKRSFYKNYIARRNQHPPIKYKEKIMDTKYTSKIGFLELLSIKIQFENYSKKKQKRCIKYLKSKGIDTTNLEWKMKWLV